MKQESSSILLLSPKERLAAILSACSDSVRLHQAFTADDALENLARRRVDIVCLDGDYRQTSAFLKRVPLKQLVKCYFVIGVTNSAAVRRRLEKQDVQYLSSHHDAEAKIPHLLQFCMGLMRMERRQKARVAVYMPGIVSEARTELTCRVTLTELSESGCRILAPHPLEIGVNVNLCLPMPESGQSITASAEVVWCDGLGQAGLAFTYIYPTEFLKYRDWLTGIQSSRTASRPSPKKSRTTPHRGPEEKQTPVPTRNSGEWHQ